MNSLAGQWGSRGGQLLLTLTAVVGALSVLVAVLAVASGVRPIVFRSGSMEPAVGTGALGFSRSTDTADLKVGDIVTVINAQKKTITHRIVAIGPSDHSATLRLKGDDNPVPDQEIYRVTDVPKLWFSIPGAGYVVAWFSNAPGSYLLGGYVVLMLMLAFRRRQDSGSTGGSRVDDVPETGPEPSPVATTPTMPPTHTAPNRKLRDPVAAVTAVAILVLTAAVVSGWSRTTWAAWNDTVATSGTTVTTASTFSGPVLTCTKGNSTVTMNWTTFPGATGYILHYGSGGATTESVGSGITSKTFNTVGQSGTFTVEAKTATVNSPLSNAKTYVIGNGVGNTNCT